MSLRSYLEEVQLIDIIVAICLRTCTSSGNLDNIGNVALGLLAPPSRHILTSSGRRHGGPVLRPVLASHYGRIGGVQ